MPVQGVAEQQNVVLRLAGRHSSSKEGAYAWAWTFLVTVESVGTDLGSAEADAAAVAAAAVVAAGEKAYSAKDVSAVSLERKGPTGNMG